MSIKIIFSNDSISNTTAACDSLGIHYTVTKGRVERWDKETNENVFVGQLKLFALKPKIKLPSDADWKPIGEFMSRGDTTRPLTTARTFPGNNGIDYRWKIKGGKLELYYASKDVSTEPLLRYHRNYFAKEQGCLDIFDSSVLEALDNIILSFLIMEKRRRD
ncbi:hypothetical protein CPB86DRAFT_623049 [Serendipita vermifera]|nr:hypothetical protein CPB86DRAFT_623049 [Serendipita vermifera]